MLYLLELYLCYIDGPFNGFNLFIEDDLRDIINLFLHKLIIIMNLIYDYSIITS